MAERVLFLTGKLAEPGLCRILGALQGPELSYERRSSTSGSAWRRS